MIHNSPSDFLSLHQNIQYYNSHKECCSLDRDLNVMDKTEISGVSHRIFEGKIPDLILKKTKEFYAGADRDDKWLKLIKKDIAHLAKTASLLDPWIQLQGT